MDVFIRDVEYVDDIVLIVKHQDLGIVYETVEKIFRSYGF